MQTSISIYPRKTVEFRNKLQPKEFSLRLNFDYFQFRICCSTLEYFFLFIYFHSFFYSYIFIHSFLLLTHLLSSHSPSFIYISSVAALLSSIIIIFSLLRTTYWHQCHSLHFTNVLLTDFSRGNSRSEVISIMQGNFNGK